MELFVHESEVNKRLGVASQPRQNFSIAMILSDNQHFKPFYGSRGPNISKLLKDCHVLCFICAG